MKKSLQLLWQLARTSLPAPLIIFFVVAGLFLGSSVLATGLSFPNDYPQIPLEQTPQGYVNAGNGYTLQDIVDILGQIRNFILIVGIIIILIFIIWGGIQYITAGGDNAKIAAAKSKIVAALIGAAIVLSAFALLATIRSVLSRRSLLPS